MAIGTLSKGYNSARPTRVTYCPIGNPSTSIIGQLLFRPEKSLWAYSKISTQATSRRLTLAMISFVNRQQCTTAHKTIYVVYISYFPFPFTYSTLIVWLVTVIRQQQQQQTSSKHFAVKSADYGMMDRDRID